MLSIYDFAKMELRIGKIVEVGEHPNADKLYVIKADIGSKEVQLVAGLKGNYSPSELNGRLIAVVVNLEPKALRGVESQGMLLAAQDESGRISILSPDKDIACGSIIR